MRLPIPIAAALITVGWLAACSKPASQSGQNADPKAGARDILLAEAPRSEGAVASELEARNAPKSAPARRAARKNVDRVAAPAEAEHDHAAMAAPAPVQELSRTATTTTDAPLRLAMATAPAAPIFGEARPLDGVAGDPRAFPDFGGRGPAIIIRGGMGSPHDDCKILPAGRSAGAAVNRMAPSLGGSHGRTAVSSGFRGGLR